jgi:hypothetical protein
MGLTYRRSSDTILVVDSEVEETERWRGVNVWEITRGGKVVSRGSTIKFSVEPTDVAYRPKTVHVFVTDDDQDVLFDVNLGRDRKMGTADDVVRGFSTRPFGSEDPEGLGFGHKRLYITDGVDQRIYRIAPGRNGIFDGVGPTGDDRVSHFGTASLGLHDPEDVEYDPVSDHLFIVSRVDAMVGETTRGGTLVNTYDLDGSTIRQPAGIAIARSTSGAGRSIYVADRGLDNDLHPHENDGRLFEFRRRAA